MAFLINQTHVDTTRRAWLKLVNHVWRYGEHKVDQRGDKIIQSYDTMLVLDAARFTDYIDNPIFEQQFLDELFAPSLGTFDYTYGSRVQPQLANCLKLLKKDINTRRAVINVYDKCDLEAAAHDRREVPCVTQGIFGCHNGKLDMTITMRSNDIVDAAPADLYGFGGIQKYMAEECDVEVGNLTLFTKNSHIIVNNSIDKIPRLLSEL